MHKRIVTTLTVLALSLGVATAQMPTPAQETEVIIVTPTIDPVQTNWVGISTGYPFGLNGHFGLRNALGDDVNLRFNASLAFAGIAFGLGLGADVLLELPIEAANFDIYAGGGPFLTFFTVGGVPGLDAASAFGLGVRGLGGAEYRFGGASEFGVFGEAGINVGIIGGFAVVPGLRLGLNYHF